MEHFLLIYNRPAGRIVRHRHFRDPHAALAARFDAEREFRGDSEIEIVVLGGDSWEAIQRSHARYFKSVQEIAKDGLERLDRLSQHA